MANDVEAGKAYVTLYLRKTTFEKQVDQAKQQAAEVDTAGKRPAGGTVERTTVEEKGISLGGVEKAVAQGAAAKAGGVMLSKAIPIFREAGTAASAAAPAIAGVGTAAAGAATGATAMGTAATAAVPAVASTGTAAAGASTGLAAMAAAAAPLLVPLAAIAAVAATVYVAIFKWDELPGVVKLLLLAISPLVLVIRALAAAFGVVRTAVNVLLAPFRAVAYAVGLAHSAIAAIPGAIMALPGVCVSAGAALGRLASRAVQLGAAMTSGAVRGLSAGVQAIGRWSAAAINATSAAMQSTGKFIAYAGAGAAALAGSIVGPLTAAAKQYAEYGQEVADVSSEYDVSVADAAVLMRAAKGTGQSVKQLAEQLKDGSRDFTRWREEARAAGLVLDGPGVGAALALTQAYQALKSSLHGLWIQLGSAVGPAITESTELMSAAIRAVTKLVSENKPLIAQVFRIASGVAAAGSAIASIGGAIAGAGALLSPFTVVLAAIAGALAMVEYRTGTGRSLWAAYGDSVRKVYATVVGYLGQMAAFAGKVFAGVKNAIMAGDLQGAVNVAWTGAKVAWIAGLMEIDKLTGGMFGGILNNLAAGNWAKAGEAAMIALQIAWQQGVIAVKAMWVEFQNYLSRTWTGVVNSADRAWVDIQNAADPALLAIQTKLNEFVAWGRTAFAEVAGFAEGFAATLVGVGKTLANLLRGAAMLSPMIGSAMTAAAVALESLAGGTGDAFNTAVEDSRKKTAKAAAKPTGQNDQLAARKQAREDALTERISNRNRATETGVAVRNVDLNDKRIQAEAEIERLRARQAELSKQGGADSSSRLKQNQAALDKAIEAAAAAKKAADEKKLTDDDFAKIEKTKKAAGNAQAGILRFSGEGLGMALGGTTNDPAAKMAEAQKLTAEGIKTLIGVGQDTIATLKEWMGKLGFK